MSYGILESDWRHLRQLKPLALDRFCKRVNAEIAAILSSDEKTAHERYLAVYRLIQKRDLELARLFNDHRRSTATMEIRAWRKAGLFNKEEYLGFSEQLRALLELP